MLVCLIIIALVDLLMIVAVKEPELEPADPFTLTLVPTGNSAPPSVATRLTGLVSENAVPGSDSFTAVDIAKMSEPVRMRTIGARNVRLPVPLIVVSGETTMTPFLTTIVVSTVAPIVRPPENGVNGPEMSRIVYTLPIPKLKTPVEVDVPEATTPVPFQADTTGDVPGTRANVTVPAFAVPTVELFAETLTLGGVLGVLVVPVPAVETLGALNVAPPDHPCCGIGRTPS